MFFPSKNFLPSRKDEKLKKKKPSILYSIYDNVLDSAQSFGIKGICRFSPRSRSNALCGNARARRPHHITAYLDF